MASIPGPETKPVGAIETGAAGVEFERLVAAATGGATRAAPRRHSRLGSALWLLSAVPGMALALLGSMAVRVRLASGAWPTRNQPDPKDLGFHNTITTVAMVASFVAVVAVPAIALIGYFTGHRRIPVMAPIVAMTGFTLLFLVLAGDLGGLGQWIGD